MSDLNTECIEVAEKPVKEIDVKFPPFPDPTNDDFDEDIKLEERSYYKNKFQDLNSVKTKKLHCSACDRHLGCAARNENRMRAHPMLRTLVCHTCHTFYNSGEFEKGDDGSELYCRWCGQGGQVYCCSTCPHVFCAKCIKRNLGTHKIKEIEELDDWKCFKCNNTCLWDLRAICWAVLRYCDLKNKIVHQTQDASLKEAFQKDCATDHSECCKIKFTRKREKQESKKKDQDSAVKKQTTAIISKIPPTIQVKKFASISLEDTKIEKKAIKRPASPKNKPILIKNPMTLQPKAISQMNLAPMPPKKIRMPNSVINPVRFSHERKQTFKNYQRIRPKPPPMPVILNGFNNCTTFSNDNINLSLESLTQGLDMNAVAAIASTSQDDDVVCTPDFPLEPLCEHQETGSMEENNSSEGDESKDQNEPSQTKTAIRRCDNPSKLQFASKQMTEAFNNLNKIISKPAKDSTEVEDECDVFGKQITKKQKKLPEHERENVTEDAGDDDVQCMTPGPAPRAPPPLVLRAGAALPDLAPENIIQMTDNDVTVNATTGGLKFRVDPQTLSSNKMYRLPDGRIFAINANPTMPGGYSATIVAVTETTGGKNASKGTTFSAKLSAILTQPAAQALKYGRSSMSRNGGAVNRSTPKSTKPTRTSDRPSRVCDMNVPIEWYRYNLIDAIDALEYPLSRLTQLKKEATTLYLRTRSMNEMRHLHHSLERSLNTSITRFKEIKDNINKEFKQYISKKTCGSASDDDDVEILPEEDNDDPIFIDENSMESNTNESQEVDLTAVASSDHNDSNERSSDKNDFSRNEDSLNLDQDQFLNDLSDVTATIENKNKDLDNVENNQDILMETENRPNDASDNEITSNENTDVKTNIITENIDVKANIISENTDVKANILTKNTCPDSECLLTAVNGNSDKLLTIIKNDKFDEENLLSEPAVPAEGADMSEELIESLLKDDSVGIVETHNIQYLDTSDEIQDPLEIGK